MAPGTGVPWSFGGPATMARRSAEEAANGKSVSSRCSDRFLAGLTNAESVIFVSHVQPDPDSLGSMLGLAYLVETCLEKPTRLTRDGLVSRAENRLMVELLDLELETVEELTHQPGNSVVMVDSQPNTGRHSLDPDIPLYAVIDHHDTPGDLEGIPFTDIRRSLGATCRIVT